MPRRGGGKMSEKDLLAAARKVDPVSFIKFRMENMDLKPKDMVRFLGSRSKVSDVLNYKRSLSLRMMRALAAEPPKGLGIPAAILLRAYKLRKSR